MKTLSRAMVVGLIRIAPLLMAANMACAGDVGPFPLASALSDDRLDELRGGFVTDNGLTISLGIERLFFVNDELVSEVVLRIPELGKVLSMLQPAPQVQVEFAVQPASQAPAQSAVQPAPSTPPLSGSAGPSSPNDRHVGSSSPATLPPAHPAHAPSAVQPAPSTPPVSGAGNASSSPSGSHVGSSLPAPSSTHSGGSTTPVAQASNAPSLHSTTAGSTATPTAGSIPAASVVTVRSPTPSVTVIQSGIRNTVDDRIAQSIGSNLATVIQNSVDKQILRAMTVIDLRISGIGSLGLAQRLSGLNEQLRLPGR